MQDRAPLLHGGSGQTRKIPVIIRVLGITLLGAASVALLAWLFFDVLLGRTVNWGFGLLMAAIFIFPQAFKLVKDKDKAVMGREQAQT